MISLTTSNMMGDSLFQLQGDCSYKEIDKKIEKSKKQIDHLVLQWAQKKTHGGKKFRTRKISLQNQISCASKRLTFLQLAKTTILKTQEETDSESEYESSEYSDYPPLLQEIADLPEDQQEERLYITERITWGNFTFSYKYPDPNINSLITEWQNNQFIIVPSDPIETENQMNKFSSHPADIRRLWDECEKRGLLREFFLAMIQHPKKFCARKGYSCPSTQFPPLKISECACPNTGAYDRLVTDRRHVFENEMIQDLKQQFPNKKEMIKIMSLGCGGLLQETILLGRLISEGFSSIDIMLIDPIENHKPYERIQTFFSTTFPEVTIRWRRAETIWKIEEQSRFDLVYAIDFDDLCAAYKEEAPMSLYECLDITDPISQEKTEKNIARIDEFRTGLGDIIQAKSLLTPRGSLFLGGGTQDMRISSSDELRLFHQHEFLKQEKALNFAPLDSVHILTNLHPPEFIFSLLATLLDKECESIHLTMEERDYTIKSGLIINGKKDEKEGTFKTTSHRLMHKIFPKFSKKIKVELVDDIRASIRGSHAVFLAEAYIRADLSEYEGATYTVIL